MKSIIFFDKKQNPADDGANRSGIDALISAIDTVEDTVPNAASRSRDDKGRVVKFSMS